MPPATAAAMPASHWGGLLAVATDRCDLCRNTQVPGAIHMFCRITTSLLAMAICTCGQVGSNVVGQWKMNQKL